MTIQRENEALIKAIFVAFGENKEFSAGDLIDRTTGLKIREPANRDMHVVLAKIFGRTYKKQAIGHRLKTMHCQTYGDLCLAQQYSRKLKHWSYTVVTTSYLREWARVDAGLEADEKKRAARIAELKETWICHPDDVLRLLNMALAGGDKRALPRAINKSVKRREIEERDEAAAAERAKIKADPELASTYAQIFHVKPGPGGAPIRDDDYRPPGAYGGASMAAPFIAKSDAELAEIRAQAVARMFPNRPPPGLKMNQWSAAQLADEKAYLRNRNTPAGIDPNSQAGFIIACNRRNQGFTS